jgi:hypothetical protein
MNEVHGFGGVGFRANPVFGTLDAALGLAARLQTTPGSAGAMSLLLLSEQWMRIEDWHDDNERHEAQACMLTVALVDQGPM